MPLIFYSIMHLQPMNKISEGDFYKMIEIVDIRRDAITLEFRELMSSNGIAYGERITHVDLSINETNELITNLKKAVKEVKGEVEDMRVSHLVKDAENKIGIYFEEVLENDVFMSDKDKNGFSRLSINLSKDKAAELSNLLHRLLNK